MQEDSLLRTAHARLRAVRDRHRDGRDGEDPSDPSTVQAMPLVLEIPHEPRPARRGLLEAAAVACVSVCLDPRAGEPVETVEPVGEPGDAGEATSEFAAALMRWYGARIRKVARRARNKKWRDVQSLPGVTAEVAGARARAFMPCPVTETPGPVNRLQIEGVDLEIEDGQEDVLADDRRPVIYVDASLGMTVGKAAAQVAHGSMLLAAEMTPDQAIVWAADGFPLHVCEVGRERFAEVRAQAEAVTGDSASSVESTSTVAAVVQDAGYTEVAPGSVTVVALTR
jgi:peptidyl-tRNA hydrolase